MYPDNIDGVLQKVQEATATPLMENAKIYDLKIAQFFCELIKIQLDFRHDNTSTDAAQSLRDILQRATSLIKEINTLEDQESERIC